MVNTRPDNFEKPGQHRGISINMREHGHIIAVPDALFQKRSVMDHHSHFVISFIVRFRRHGQFANYPVTQIRSGDNNAKHYQQLDDPKQFRILCQLRTDIQTGPDRPDNHQYDQECKHPDQPVPLQQIGIFLAFSQPAENTDNCEQQAEDINHYGE